ncbi:hypothetical protein RHECIAT_CH0000507 [Rhizobium etli CIAT 652]|uniref:Uncharacterized protein n=1 Tax=Rhizobium etli (strain CIAT 652) TaxID=491916 RepID=B3Q068_RHIE6|nr:hypothetical protein RHECIAT_CH0000507 [Rhizobium etli CIAT 652]
MGINPRGHVGGTKDLRLSAVHCTLLHNWQRRNTMFCSACGEFGNDTALPCTKETPDYESGGQEFESLRVRHFLFHHLKFRMAPNGKVI